MASPRGLVSVSQTITLSRRNSLSKITLAVPLPWQDKETKIQPSLERVNVNGVPDFEMEETSSNSETRLFSFFSPEKRTSAPAVPTTPKIEILIDANSLAFIRNRDGDAV